MYTDYRLVSHCNTAITNTRYDHQCMEPVCHIVVYTCYYQYHTGVVETGLFIKMVEKVYFGSADGSVRVVNKASEL